MNHKRIEIVSLHQTRSTVYQTILSPFHLFDPQSNFQLSRSITERFDHIIFLTEHEEY